MSGLIPQHFLDELIQRTDIVELIDGYVPLKKRGNSYIACCPFHNEKTPSFNVVANKQFYHCFGCGQSGNVISFVMSYLNQGFTDAVETLATRLGMTVPRDEKQAERNRQSQTLYELMNEVCLHYQKQLKHQGQGAIQYLKQRGLTGETAKRYQIGYAPDDWHHLEQYFKKQKEALLQTGMLIKNEQGNIYDRYRKRIMFPIHDRHGRIIGFGGRSIDADQQPKYLNSPETVIFQKNRELYGLHQALQNHQKIDSIIVVEGYMDVIMLAQHGVNNAVATLGTATSGFHIQLLSRHCQRLYFCFDGDEAGKKAAWRALENSLPHLNEGLDAIFVFLPQGHDPDSYVQEFGREHFLQTLQEGQTLEQLLFSTLVQNIDLSHQAGRTRLINECRPYMNKIPEGAFRQLLLDELGRKTHIDSDRLANMLAQTEENQLPKPNVQIQRTPQRIAIALLIQNPSILQKCREQIQPEQLDSNEHFLLKQLMQYISQNPDCNTAKLIENWRNTDFFDSLNKLAAWQHQVPEQEQHKVFIDHILFLEKQNKTSIIQQLIEKSRQSPLSDEEKQQLSAMLKERHLLTN